MVKDIKLMESVQRRATKIVPKLSLLLYEERLNKMLNGLIDIDRENFFPNEYLVYQRTL